MKKLLFVILFFTCACTPTSRVEKENCVYHGSYGICEITTPSGYTCIVYERSGIDCDFDKGR